MQGSAMRGPVAMLAIFAALYALATATRRLFLSGVTSIADEQAPQPMWRSTPPFSCARWKTSPCWGLQPC